MLIACIFCLVNKSAQSFIDWKDDYDVALIKLKNPFEIGLPFVNPACLPIADKFKDETEWDGERLDLVGKEFTIPLLSKKFGINFAKFKAMASIMILKKAVMYLGLHPWRNIRPTLIAINNGGQV